MKCTTARLLMIVLFMSLISSCTKKTNIVRSEPVKYGKVLFWTRNAANLSQCGNSIDVSLFISAAPWGVTITNTAHINYLVNTAPGDCNGVGTLDKVLPGKYYFSTRNCVTGITPFVPQDSFHISADECLVFEIR